MIILGEDALAEVERTEHLMNVVVEMRKKHGAACIDYARKTLQAEHQLLKVSLEATLRANFKPKATIPAIDVDAELEVLKEFDSQLGAVWQRVEDLQRRVTNTQGALQTMRRADPLLAASRRPVTAEALLARARSKHPK